MNTKGATMFVAFMIGIVCFFLGLALTPAIEDVVFENTHNDILNCSNVSLGQQDKATCTSTDLFIPLITGLCFGLGGMLIGALAIK